MVFSQLSSFVCQALSHQSSPAKKPVPVKPSRATEIFTPLTESLTFGNQPCLYLRKDSALGHGRLSLRGWQLLGKDWDVVSPTHSF